MKLSSGLRHLVAMMAALFLGGEVAGGGLWARVWRHEGYQAFSQGSFEDSGSNIYVSRRGRIQLINRLDLNRDGHIDLFVANGHGHSEDEDAYVYLNNGETIDPRRRIALPTNGAVEGLVADLDRDGVNDVVVVNGTGGTTSRSDSFVYYGAEGRFPVSQRRQLRSWAGKEAAVGDWNRDGWPDLAIACANAGRDEQSSHSVVYWNSAHGFDPDRRTPLAGPGTAVLAADLAGDEALDLVLAAGTSVFVYAAGKDGLDLEKPLVLDVEARHLGAGDLDRDGRIELFVAVESEVQVRAAPSDGFQVLQRLPVENPWQLAVQDLNRDGLPDLAVTSSDHGGNGYTDSLVFWNRNGRLSETDPTPLATVHARGISAGDLDGDGWPELVVSNNHSFNDLNVQSFVFWNREGKFLPAHKSMLDTRSAHGNGVGDVDNDGHPDVIFFNLEGGLRTGHNPNFIYWGDGTRNYSTRRRSQLWAGYTVGTAQADLDDDGWVDLVSAEARYALGRPVTLNGVYVWYGGAGGYEPRRRAVLSVEDPEMGAVTADLNRDGYLDLVIGAAERDAKGRPGYVILYGAGNGFSPARREVIPIGGLGFPPVVADWNRDGYLDLAGGSAKQGAHLVYGSEEGFREKHHRLISQGRVPYLEAADFDSDGWLDLVAPVNDYPRNKEGEIRIYYGSGDGFRLREGRPLRHMSALDPSVADFDRDGFLDLFVPNYSSNTARSVPCFLYWGSASGFDPDRRLELPGDSGTASLAADFDGDGWTDIFLLNHKRDGNRDRPGDPIRHTTPSVLYWNGPDGFSLRERTWLPTVGPHGQMIRDPGNIYTRELAETYVSPPHRFGAGVRPVSIGWDAETPLGTMIALQIRTAKDREALEKASWTGPSGPDSWFLEPGPISGSASSASWLQYRARLATPNGGASPLLTRVEVRFQ